MYLVQKIEVYIYEESWTIKKAERWRIDAFELWCWRRLLRVPWRARSSYHLILKEINPEYSLEGLMLKLKLQSFGHLMQSQLIGKDPDAGKDWRQEEKGTTEDMMVGWHHWLDRHEFEQALGVGDAQASLACCNPWGCKELDVTEWLNVALIYSFWTFPNANREKTVMLKVFVLIQTYHVLYISLYFDPLLTQCRTFLNSLLLTDYSSFQMEG